MHCAFHHVRYVEEDYPDLKCPVCSLTAENAALREVLVTAKQETKWHDRRTGHKCMCAFCEAVRAALDAAKEE